MRSSGPAVAVSGLGKKYAIRHNYSEPITLAETLVQRARHPLRRAQHEEFWALRDVSLTVAQGETVGVIGANGAGKSTLLKLLTRITEPSAGQIDLWGRVGSLLEVGTGFHPELTGRENIYLNGSILGMTRREIGYQFDAIVNFAGVERFLDTPVKRFSSGMYVRLAFAVAAHLQSEILLVDEVLSVGDTAFQAQCIEKMSELASDGRTVFFVSHHMPSVRKFCSRAIFLESGQLVADGEVREVTSRYLSSGLKDDVPSRPRQYDRGAAIVLERMWPRAQAFRPDEEKTIRFLLRRTTEITERCFVSVVFRRAEGETVAHCDSTTVGRWYVLDQVTIEGACTLYSPWLLPGDYRVDAFICNAGILDAVENACTFHVYPMLPYAAPPDAAMVSRDRVLPNYTFELEGRGTNQAPDIAEPTRSL